MFARRDSATIGEAAARASPEPVPTEAGANVMAEKKVQKREARKPKKAAAPKVASPKS